MSTASSSTNVNIPDGLPEEVDRWSPTAVIQFLQANAEQYFLDDEEIDIVKGNKVAGVALLELTVEQLRSIGLGLGPAAAIAKLVEKLKENKGLVERGK